MKNIIFIIFTLFFLASLSACTPSSLSPSQKISSDQMLSADKCQELGGEIIGHAQKCGVGYVNYGVVSDVKGSDRSCCKQKNDACVTRSCMIENCLQEKNEHCTSSLIDEVSRAGYLISELNKNFPNYQCIESINNTSNELFIDCDKKPANIEKPEITITTNKNEYKQGEEINITIKNNLAIDTYYNHGGDRFWNLEYFEDDTWKRYGYDGRNSFQLSEDKLGEKCYIALYERAAPFSLPSKKQESTSWNQMICLFTDDYAVPSIVRYIPTGKYRLSFHYGFSLTDNGWQILEPQIIYSNVFSVQGIEKNNKTNTSLPSPPPPPITDSVK